MFGQVSVAALEERASAVARRADEAPAQEILPQARETLQGLEAELERDEAELGEAEKRYSAQFWPLSRYVPGYTAKSYASVNLAPQEREVAGDRAAIARLGATVSRLNQRVDEASYSVIERRMSSYDVARGRAVLASMDGNGKALELFSKYARGQSASAAPAALILALGASSPGAVDSSSMYATLRQSRSLTTATAALLAVHGKDPAGIRGVETSVGQGMHPTAAAILATAPNGPTRNDIYTRLRAANWDESLAAQTAAAAARAGVPTERALRIANKLLPAYGAEATATLASVVFATNRPIDQVTAAYDWFAGRGRDDGAIATAAWALQGNDHLLMASLTALRYRAIDDGSFVMSVATTMGPAR